MDKMTNVKALSFVLTNYADSLPADVAEKLSAICVSLEKKSSAQSKAQQEKRAENDGYKAILLTILSSDHGKTCSELIKEMPALPNGELWSTSKMSRLANDMVTAGQATKETVKGKTLFFLA